MIWLILLLAFILRLVNINQSLWLDEAIGAVEVFRFGPYDLINNFLKVDNHPPLYYLVLDFWSYIFGYSEFALRLPSILFGLGTVFLVYKIARLLIPKNNFFAYSSALIIATSQFAVYYSQEARMYAMAGFFASLVIYLLIILVNNKNVKPKIWVFFSASIIALFFSDYMPVFIYPVLFIYPLISKVNKQFWIKFLAAQLPLFILGIFWLPVMLIQMKGGSWLIATLPSWQSVAGGATPKQAMLLVMKFIAGRISLTQKIYYWGFVIAASLPVLVSFFLAFRNYKKGKILFLWLFIPIILGFVASIFFPAFIYFRYLYVFPAFCLVLGYGLSLIKKNWFRNLLLIFIVLFNLISFIVYASDQNQQREQWRQAVEYVESNSDINSIVLQEFPDTFAPYRWYEKGLLPGKGATDSISANKEETIERTKKLLDGKNKVFYFEYLADLTDPNRYVIDTIINSKFIPTQEKTFVGVGKVTTFVLSNE